MNIKVGDVYKIAGKYYVVTRKISKPYSLTKLHCVDEDEEHTVPTLQLIKFLENMEEK